MSPLASEPRRIGVAAEDPGLGLIAAASLGLAGFSIVPVADARRASKDDPTLDGLVVVGAAADAPSPPRVAAWPVQGDAPLGPLVERARAAWAHGAARASWESGPVRVPLARLVAGLGRLRPDMKLVCDTPRGKLGVCAAGGHIVSIGLEGHRLLDDRDVAADPALRLVLTSFARDHQGAPPSLGELHAELAIVCEYADLFAASRGFADHAERVLASVLADDVTAVHAEGHAPSSHGTDVLTLLFRVLVRDAGARAGLVPPGPLHAPDGLPRWLRAALPPQRYGRLFFALEDGASAADAIAKGRLPPEEGDAAVALGVLAGAVVAREPITRGGARLRTQTLPMANEPAALQDLASALRTPPVTRPTDPPPLPAAAPAELDPRACGAPARYFDILRNAAEEGQRHGRRTRVAGTRFEPVGERLGDILLYFRIGSGGTGDVFLGVQGGQAFFQKTVAVKRLGDAAGTDERFRRSFLDEARLASWLEHPNIAHIFRLVEDDGRHHLVMEFVHGVSVAQLAAGLKTAGEAAPEAIVRWIGAEAARGLHYMHQRRNDDGDPLGLVHRDVAPPNILLGFDGSVKLIDLSIAQSTGDTRALSTSVGTRSGRLGYSAPEVLAGLEVGPAADLFGLAVTLYELLVGARCFARGTPHTIIDTVMRGEFEPILKLRPDVSPRLAYAIERGLSLQAGSRFKDLATFREALLRESGEPDPAGRMEVLLEARFGELRVRERDAIERMRRSAAGMFAAGLGAGGGGSATSPRAPRAPTVRGGA